MVLESEAARVHSTLVPAKGDVIRNLEPKEEVGRMLKFSYGKPLVFSIDGAEGGRTEELLPELDIYGNWLLKSNDNTLYYEHRPNHFTVFDTLGRRGSVLHLIHAALSRFPFEASPKLGWQDVLPLRHFLPLWARIPLDLISPFLQNTGIEVQYRARREGGS